LSMFHKMNFGNNTNSWKIAFALTCLHLEWACVSPRIIVSTDKKASVSLVGFNDAASNGQILGDAPQSVDLAKLETKFLKVWGPGLVPQYWVFGNVIGRETKIALKMEELAAAKDDKKKKPDDEKKDDKKPEGGSSDQNLSHRLLMQSYHALTIGDLELARNLANKLREINPNIASPHIVIGISYLEQGSKTDAASAFGIAKTLDPQDAEIDRLIEAAR